MSKRIGLSKKLRFEVFKRDRFTCQYCGGKAPDVVLHVDHVRPVADDGKNDILNLVTACVDCNSGKGARKLDDQSAVERQRVQLEELQERREQLEMMLEWRDQAEQHKVDVVSEVADRIGERGGFVPNENGRTHIRRWLKRFTLKEVLAALDESFDHYMQYIGDKPDEKAWGIAFDKIPAIASLQKQAIVEPYLPRLAYIQGILRRRFDRPRMGYIDALREIHLDWRVPIDVIEGFAKQDEDWDDMNAKANAWQTMRSWKDQANQYEQDHCEEEVIERERAQRAKEEAEEQAKLEDDGYDNDGYGED